VRCGTLRQLWRGWLEWLGVVAVLPRLAPAPNILPSHVLLRPERITMSSVATKSAMTASASCRPARTDMMSELGFVYFLVRAASRKTVKVWLVSRRNCVRSFVAVPRAQPRPKAFWPA
jgi:hypothetical protein